MRRADADRAVPCPKCKKSVKAAERNVSIAKVLSRHVDKCHKSLSTTDRTELRRRVFSQTHVLCARTVSVANAWSLPLEASTFDAVTREREQHGSSRAQATAHTASEAMEEHFLRSSLAINPGLLPLSSSTACTSKK